MHHWLKMNADYFTFPTVLAGVLYADSALAISRPFSWFGSMCLGFVMWTFAEYWIHRSLLHRFFWHGTHEHHHTHPKDDVAFPLWYVPAGFVMIFIPFYIAARVPLAFAYAAFAGVVCGYLWFMFMHHMLHHNPTIHPWMERFAIWHNRHHKIGDMNYGITTNIWDRLFGTSH